MKKLLLPLALAFASNAAMAANSVDLRVTGSITPAACDISLAGGDFALGDIKSSDLSAAAPTDRPAVGGKTLSISCNGPTQVAYKSIDNRADSATSSNGYGLGMDGANNPIGHYIIEHVLSSILVNGNTGQLKGNYSDGSGSWVGFSGTEMPLHSYANESIIYALDLNSSSPTATPAPITNASTELQVVATIQPLEDLDTSNNITLDGSATIELVYL